MPKAKTVDNCKGLVLTVTPCLLYSYYDLQLKMKFSFLFSPPRITISHSLIYVTAGVSLGGNMFSSYSNKDHWFVYSLFVSNISIEFKGLELCYSYPQKMKITWSLNVQLECPYLPVFIDGKLCH